MMEEGRKNRQKTRITQTGPSDSSDEAKQLRMEQRRKEADNQLLLDAGIAVDDMGEEEKIQILEALRQSLPVPEDPAPGDSDQASTSGEEENSAEKLAEVSEDSVSREKSVKESEELAELSENLVPSAGSSEDKDSKEDDEELPENSMPPPEQSLDVMSLNYDSSGGEEGLECDSTTSSKTAPVPEDRTFSLRPKLETGQREAGQHRQTRASEVAKQDMFDDDSGSDTFTAGDTLDTDLLTRTTKKLSEQQSQSMRLSNQQKQQGQSRFKELFSKTNLSQSRSSDPSESPVKDSGSGNKEVHSSQDLFGEQASDDETDDSTQPDCSDVKAASKTRSAFCTASAAPETRRASAPSLPSSPMEGKSSPPYSSGEGDGAEEEEEVNMEDETQPPEDNCMIDVEEDSGDDTLQQQVADSQAQSSPVYPMQMDEAGRSSPSPDKTSGDASCLTPSNLPEKDNLDHRPLPHDNCFTWHQAPPVCCLHRTYGMSSRKRKEPASESKPYFCPEEENVAAYSEVIMCMLDSYLQRFSAMQSRLHTILPWGKPIRAGQHRPGSLDYKKRGQPTFQLDLINDDDDDDDDFQDRQPQPKKVPSLRQKRIGSDDEVSAGMDNEKVKMKAVDDCASVLTHKPDDGGDRDNTAAYDAETQPLDSDSDLPDLYVEPAAEAVDSSWGRKWLRPEKRRRRLSPPPVSEDSQSSNSLLNEQGELYSTQLPRRKRAGRTEADEAPARVKRPRRAAQTASIKDSGRNSPEKVRPLSRKRKQIASDDEDSKVRVLNVNEEEAENEEVSFPQLNKLEVRRKKASYVHISSTVGSGEGRPAVVHPIPRGNQDGEPSGRVLHITIENNGKQLPQPSTSSNVSSTSDVRGGSGDEEEDSDDSVQYRGPASFPAPAPAPAPAPLMKVQQVGQEAGLEEAGDRGMAATRSQAQEPEDSAESGSEEMVTCPLCYKEFASSVIERHASDCSLELDRDEAQAPDHSTAPIALPPASVLKRPPLRGHPDREEYVCSLCNVKQGGSGALKRHFEVCRQKYQEEEASCSTKPDSPVDRRRAVTPSLTPSQHWLCTFKIPKKTPGTTVSERVTEKNLSIVLEEDDEDEIVSEESEDSDKDPPFRPTEDDNRKQEDQGEGRRAGSRQSRRQGSSKEQH